MNAVTIFALNNAIKLNLVL